MGLRRGKEGGRTRERVCAGGSYFLRHRSGLGEFKLSSDAITNRLLERAKRLVAQIPPEQMPHYRGYTIGSAVLFPKTAPPGGMTINQARGMQAGIADRFDLTLECIRRHYLGEDSLLANTLLNYEDFFALFEDFAGYVDFWLLGGPHLRWSGALLDAVRRLSESRSPPGRRVVSDLPKGPRGLHHREEPAD